MTLELVATDPPVRAQQLPEWLEARKHTATADRDRQRLREIGTHAAHLDAAEAGAALARGQLASRLFYWHEDGLTIGALAAAASLDLATATGLIDEYRSAVADLNERERNR